MSETAGGATTKYLVDMLNPTRLPQVLDEIVNGSVTRTYAYGVQRISENQLVGGTWTPSFYGYDGHGNVRFLTNTAGTSSIACPQVQALDDEATSYKNGTIPYRAPKGPTSNTLAHYLGQKAGFNPSAPPKTIGCGWDATLSSR